MMLIRIKQHLNNIWRSIHEKVKPHWSWLEKKCCLKKAVVDKHSFHFLLFGNLQNFWVWRMSCDWVMDNLDKLFQREQQSSARVFYFCVDSEITSILWYHYSKNEVFHSRFLWWIWTNPEDRVFKITLSGWDGKFCGEEFFYRVVEIWRGVISTIWTFISAKSNIL